MSRTTTPRSRGASAARGGRQAPRRDETPGRARTGTSRAGTSGGSRSGRAGPASSRTGTGTGTGTGSGSGAEGRRTAGTARTGDRPPRATAGSRAPRADRPRSDGPRTTARPFDGSRATFRRRRAVVVVLLLALVAGAAIGVRALVGVLAGSGAEAGPRTMPTAPLTPDPDAPAGPPTEAELANPVECRPGAVDLAVTLPGATVPAGGGSFGVTVTNAGEVPCLLEVGRSGLRLALLSGDDLVWTSAQCPVTGDRRILLDVGDADVVELRWAGTRSAEGCPKGQPDAGAGTYRAVVTLLAPGDDDTTLARVEEPFTLR